MNSYVKLGLYIYLYQSMKKHKSIHKHNKKIKDDWIIL